MMKINRILVPTDFSDNSKSAVDYGCELARQFGAELQVIHVVDSLDTFPMEIESIGAVGLGHDIVEAKERASKLLQDLPAVDGQDCRIVRATEIGNPTTEIIRFAKQNRTDLIVISTHGRTGLRHLLMGSVAESVVRKAPCPVLTVRPEGHQFTTERSKERTQQIQPDASVRH